MVNPVGWFEIYVEDLKRAKKFYETVFATQLSLLESPLPEVEMWCFPMFENQPGASGALVKMKNVNPGGMGTIVYFSSEDCAIEAGRIDAAGGILQQDKMSIGEYGYTAMGVDTEGNIFGIHSNG